jgi:hypothetical protein
MDQTDIKSGAHKKRPPRHLPVFRSMTFVAFYINFSAGNWPVVLQAKGVFHPVFSRQLQLPIDCGQS